MFQGEIKTGFLELPGPKFVTKIVANITKEHQRRARRTHTKGTLPKRSIKAASMDALSSQKENLDALAALPRTTVNPITERREQVIKKRAKVSKRNKKANTSLKKNAAAKIKAARLQRHKETRTAQKQDALDKALAKEWEERYRAEAAERAAFVAMKELEPAQKVTFVDSIYQVRDLVDEVMSLSNPALYLDAEGSHTYVIDVWALGTETTFHTPGNTSDTTFIMLLEDPSVPKLFWDCRMDSEALYHQHGVSLTGVVNVQLIEVASRPHNHSLYRLQAYGRAVSMDAGLDWYDKAKMETAKGAKSLFIPRFGGSWDTLTTRPLAPALLDYCSGDMQYMSKLFKKYSENLLAKDQLTTVDTTGMFDLAHPANFFENHHYHWTNKVVNESAERIRRSQQEGWNRENMLINVSPW